MFVHTCKVYVFICVIHIFYCVYKRLNLFDKYLLRPHYSYYAKCWAYNDE